ncbi:prolipoprotein diacylglyceryl transferase [Gudongella sp. DL1XJH-153]|uniref:prolipoprotein diacylglyceryl transferase n=1 Tax=Gudongella sp. DL1XJH-153 TaxID=3409804 RepID=UPI003BB69D4C
MKPVMIIDMFGLETSVGSYGLFMTLAAMLVIVVSIYCIYKAGLPMKSGLLCLALIAISLPIGARALNVAINSGFYTDNPHRVFALDTLGFSLMGGLLLSAFVGIVLTRIMGMDFWRLGDSIAPGLGIGLGVMRLGCYFNGCCYGLESSVPWAVRFPYNSPAHKHFLSLNSQGTALFKMLSSPSVHPTQLYEMAGSFLAAAIAFYLIKKRAKPGVPILVAAIVFTTTRLANHFLRIHPLTNEISIWFYPVAYILILILLSVTLYRKNLQ